MPDQPSAVDQNPAWIRPKIIFFYVDKKRVCHLGPDPGHIGEDPDPCHIGGDPDPGHIGEDPDPGHRGKDPAPGHLKKKFLKNCSLTLHWETSFFSSLVNSLKYVPNRENVNMCSVNVRYVQHSTFWNLTYKVYFEMKITLRLSCKYFTLFQSYLWNIFNYAYYIELIFRLFYKYFDLFIFSSITNICYTFFGLYCFYCFQLN